MIDCNTINAYYLDWNNKKNTTEANVKKILDDFWQRFASVDEQTAALRTLKLKADASQREITRSYRELASRHHPDKGGDKETFIHIRQAYELLR
jgi:DnaJ-class molecular chaperone